MKAICFDVELTLSNTDDQFVEKLVKFLTPVDFLFHYRDFYPIDRRFVMFTEDPGNWLYALADSMGLDNKIVSPDDRL